MGVMGLMGNKGNMGEMEMAEPLPTDDRHAVGETSPHHRMLLVS